MNGKKTWDFDLMITLASVLPVMNLIVYRNDEANFRSAKLSSVSSKYNYHFLLMIGYKSVPATTQPLVACDLSEIKTRENQRLRLFVFCFMETLFPSRNRSDVGAGVVEGFSKN